MVRRAVRRAAALTPAAAPAAAPAVRQAAAPAAALTPAAAPAVRQAAAPAAALTPAAAAVRPPTRRFRQLSSLQLRARSLLSLSPAMSLGQRLFTPVSRGPVRGRCWQQSPVSARSS